MLTVRILLIVLVFLAGIGTAQRPILPISSLPVPEEAPESDSDPLSDFPEKGLPPATVFGPNPSIESGIEAARRVMKFDDDSLPMLMAALQKGGFTIIDTNGKPLYLPRSGPGLDIAFFDFEVAGMLRSVGFGVGTSVPKLAKLYAGNGAEMSQDEFARRMLADIRGMRNSTDEHIKFLWGFMAEMSRITPDLGDLASAPPANVKLNMIQASIVERLLLRDLLVKFEILSAASGTAKRGLFTKDRNEAFFAAVSWSTVSAADCGIIDDIAELKKAWKTGSKIGDTVATYGGVLKDYNHVLDLQNSQTVKASSVAGAALAWAKVLMAFMNIKADFEIQKPMPLIRTKKSGFNMGQQRDVSVKFIMNFPRTQIINCVAKAFDTATGIDLSIPDGGPMADVPVEWSVLLEGRGISRYTDVPVWVDATTRSDISRQKTDSSGKSTIRLTGKPQPRDMENEPVVPMPKTVRLRATMALEKMDAAKDIPKIIKANMGPVIDPIGLIEQAADFIQKIPLKSFRVTVPVRDWQPCAADWGGNITYTKRLQQSIAVKGTRKSNGNSTGDGFRQFSKYDFASVELNPRTKAEIAAGTPPKPAQYYVNGLHTDVFSGTREGDPCCGPSEGSYNVKFRQGSEMKYSQTFTGPVDVRVITRQRDFSLALGIFSETFKTLVRSFYEVDDTNCPLDKAEAYEEYSDGMHMLTDMLEDGRYGERYADETGEILAGQKVVTGRDGSTITWTWQLARCKQ